MAEHDHLPRVRIRRIVDAPVALVWDMWTVPDHFRAWYGPVGATVPVAEMDLRVGGRRRVCMEMATPGGPRRMWFTGEYREIVTGARLVYTEAMADEDGNVLPAEQAGLPTGHPVVTEITVEFAGHPDGTGLTLVHAGIPEGSPGEAGWLMALDKLVVAIARS